MRAKSRSIPLLLAVLVVGTSAWMSTPRFDATITGRIVDEQSGSPIASAQVFVEAMNKLLILT